MRQVLDAAFNVVHDYDTEALARLLGKARGTLCHEVNPPQGSSAKFGLLDAVRVTLKTRRYDILFAYAEVCNFVCTPLPAAIEGDASTQEILVKSSTMAKEFADSVAVLNQSLADGRVTGNELRQFDEESLQMIEAVIAVRNAVRAKAERDAVPALKVVA